MKAAVPPSFCASATICRATVVFLKTQDQIPPQYGPGGESLQFLTQYQDLGIQWELHRSSFFRQLHLTALQHLCQIVFQFDGVLPPMLFLFQCVKAPFTVVQILAAGDILVLGGLRMLSYKTTLLTGMTRLSTGRTGSLSRWLAKPA